MKIRQIIKEYEVPDVVDATDTYASPSNGYAIRVHGPLGSPRSNQTPAAALWYGLSEVFPRDYPAAGFQNIGQQMASPQAKILNTIRREGSAVVKSGIASRDLAETLANKLGNYGPPPPPDETVGKIPMSNIEVVSQNMNEAYDPGLSSKLIAAGTKVAQQIFVRYAWDSSQFRTMLEHEYNISAGELLNWQISLNANEIIKWMNSKGSELHYDKSNPIEFEVTIPGSDPYNFNIAKVLKGTNESLDEVEEGLVDTVKDKYSRFKDYFDDSPEAVERKLARLRATNTNAQSGAPVAAQSGQDPYMILGIEHGADSNAIKLAYRRLAKKHHPDAGGNAAEFQKIKAAFNQLLASGAVIREGTPGLPDPNNFDSDNDYYDARDAYAKPQDTDSDYENMDDAESDDWFDESKEKVGNMDADAFDAALSRMKKLAGAGPLRTVYDPARRVYKNVPHAVQPAQQPKKAR